MRTRADGLRGPRLGDKEFKLPEPHVRRRVLHGEPTVDAGTLSRSGTDMNRFSLRTVQLDLELFAWPTPVRAAAQKHGIARLDRLLAPKRGGDIPRSFVRALTSGLALRRDVPFRGLSG